MFFLNQNVYVFNGTNITYRSSIQLCCKHQSWKKMIFLKYSISSLGPKGWPIMLRRLPVLLFHIKFNIFIKVNIRTHQSFILYKKILIIWMYLGFYMNIMWISTTVAAATYIRIAWILNKLIKWKLIWSPTLVLV